LHYLRVMSGIFQAPLLLALIGWYLIVPPNKDGQILIDRPLSKWTYLNSFDSARECREAGLEHVRQAETDTPADRARLSQAQAWECIATDDPRLAK